MVEFFIGSDNPALSIFWRDWTGALVDFSSNYSFVTKVGTTDGSTTSFTKATGHTGAVGSLTATPQVPNLTIAWDTSGELNTLTAGLYLVQIQATNTGDNRQRFMQLIMEMKSVLT